jgi:hypothetical protein
MGNHTEQITSAMFTPICGVMQHLDLSDEEAAALIKAPFSFNAPLRRGLVPPSRCGMVAAEFGFCRSVTSGSRGRSIGRDVMNRNTVALFLLFGAGLLFAAVGIGANLVPRPRPKCQIFARPARRSSSRRANAWRRSPRSDARRLRSSTLRRTGASRSDRRSDARGARSSTLRRTGA